MKGLKTCRLRIRIEFGWFKRRAGRNRRGVGCPQPPARFLHSSRRAVVPFAMSSPFPTKASAVAPRPHRTYTTQIFIFEYVFGNDASRTTMTMMVTILRGVFMQGAS